MLIELYFTKGILMKRIFLFHNKMRKTLHIKNKIITILKDNDFILSKHKADLILVIGGDGTMLSAIRTLNHLKTPFLGVNTGNLGFLPAVLPHEITEIPNIIKSNNTIENYPLLHVLCESIDGEKMENYAFNEIVVKQSLARMLEAHIYINEKPFNYFTGDGIVFSNPIGTTGYSIWASGAAIHPELDVYQMTPLHPNDNRVNRPLKHSIVLPNSTNIKIDILKANSRGVNLASDGRILNNAHLKKAYISMSNRRVKIMRKNPSDYFTLFRDKIIDKRISKFLSKGNR